LKLVCVVNVAGTLSVVTVIKPTLYQAFFVSVLLPPTESEDNAIS